MSVCIHIPPLRFFLKGFFMWTIFKVLWDLLQYCFCCSLCSDFWGGMWDASSPNFPRVEPALSALKAVQLRRHRKYPPPSPASDPHQMRSYCLPAFLPSTWLVSVPGLRVLTTARAESQHTCLQCPAPSGQHYD